jgi:hypothetical protein
MKRSRKWLAGSVTAFALVAAIDFGVSMLVGSRKISRLLTADLQASFGRPVQVAHYAFSLWEGPAIEADSVVIREDPRFGNEYFLRAGEIDASLRWGSLLRGRVEFGSFSLSNASLNIVTAGGQWNLADWLPRPSSSPAAGSSRARRLYRIDIDNGRINFKRGTVKLPFALIGVNGSVDETSPGRWSISLAAQPLRAAVTLQDAGTLLLEGQVGGTSARLRPANLHLLWQDASLSDVLRLLFGYDYGVRGRQDLDLLASSSGQQWRFELDVRESGVHRWVLAAEPINPGLNVRLAGAWSPGEGNLTLASGKIQGPASSIALTGGLNWPVANLEGSGDAAHGPRLHLRLATDGVSARDLLSWYRSFHQSIPASLRAAGWLEGSAEIGGWPPRIEQASIETAAIRAQGGVLAKPVELGPANLRMSAKDATIAISDLDFGHGIARFQVKGKAAHGRRWSYRLEATGSSAQVGGLVSAIKALGVQTPSYWSEFTGGASFRVDWSGTIPSTTQTAQAAIDFHNVVWQEPSLPAHVRLDSAHIQATGNQLRFDVRSAQALGATWHGWLERQLPSGPWQFDLAANGLDGRTLLARLRPQEQRPSLLERIFGFGHAAGSPPLWPASLNASGTLEIGRLLVSRLSLGAVRGRMTIHNGSLEFSPVRAFFYGGGVQGSFFFSVEHGVPVWRLGARVSEVNLARLSRAYSPGGKNRFSGLASGNLQLSARLATARSWVDSLQGDGRISIRNARDAGTDWLSTLEAGHLVSGRSAFQACSAQIRLAAGKLTLQKLSAVSRRGRLEATGGIDLTRGGTLSVQARYFPFNAFAPRRTGLAARTYQVTGNSTNPLIRMTPPAVASKVSVPSR